MLEIVTIEKEGSELESIRQLFADYQAELQEDSCFQDFEKERLHPLQKYGAPAGTLLLAYWNGEVAGCIALTPLKEEGFCKMKRLYVGPAFRRHGIGKQLVERLLLAAKAKGYTAMKLDTLQRLQPAITLYGQYGFVPRVPCPANPINDVIYMERQLTE